jgi:hypothetical protein
LEHNQTTSELLSFSLCIACYEAVLQMLEHWLETIKCVNSLSLAEQLGRPIANQIEKQSRRWQNMLFSSKPPLLKSTMFDDLFGNSLSYCSKSRRAPTVCG